ncbi:MAG: hypothetical protein ACR2PO_09485 [Methyloligellaceae bacterium]
MAKPKHADSSDGTGPAVAGAVDSELLADDGMDEILIGLDSFAKTDEGFTLAKDLSVADLIADHDQAPEIDLSRLLGSEVREPDAETVAEVETDDAGLPEFATGFGPTAIAILVDDDSSDGGVTI